MDLGTLLGLAAIVVLVLANGFFVATEFAIVAVRRAVSSSCEEGTPARPRQDVVAHLDAYIAACQLGITMASLALGWIGEPALAHVIEPPLERRAGSPRGAHAVAVAVSFALITALHIVIGELAPEGARPPAAGPDHPLDRPPAPAFDFVFRWPIAPLNAIGNAVPGALRSPDGGRP